MRCECIDPQGQPIKGLYAAGDITGTPYQDAKAVGEGNVAAISAVGYLASKKV